MRKQLFQAVGLTAGAQLGLWTLDVLVNLGLAKKVFRSHELLGTPTDFAGLFLADLQIAVLVVTVAWMLGPVLARVLRSGNAPLERLILVTAMLVALTVAVGSSFLWGGLVGLLGWMGLRLVFKHGSSPPSNIGEILSYIFWPLLVAGFGVHGLDYAMTGTWVPAAANGAASVLALAGVVVVSRLRTRGWALALGGLPLWLALGLAAQLCVVSAFFYGNRAVSEKREDAVGPNIILIVLDTVRADRLKGFGHNRDTMPALERWGSNALVAMRAVSPAGWTSPAHASIFSGKSVSRHGIHYGSGRERRDPFRTRAFDGISWLPELLAERGYDCLAVSANQLAVPQEIIGFRRVLNPDHSDWDRTIGGFADRHSPLTARLSERLRWRMPYIDAQKMVDITMRTVPDGSGPVFLFINLIDAHSPYHPPPEALEGLGIANERLFSRYLNHTELTRRWEALPEGKEQHVKALYDGELRSLDSSLERLLIWIDDRLGEDSVVIVTSDHGEELGEQGRVGHEYGLAQSLVHVPLYVRSPGLPVGRTDAVVSLTSLFDFIKASALGKEEEVKMVLSKVSGEATFSERYPCGACVRDFGPEYGRPWVSLTDGSFKAVGPSAYGLELYRLDERSFDQEAPHADPRLAEAMGEQIDRHWEGHQDTRETDGSPSLSMEEWQRLKALGYVN